MHSQPGRRRSRCFKYNTVEEIVEALENEAKERQWAEETLDMLRKASPTSLKVTLELLRRGARMSLGQCIQTEFKLASQFIVSANIYAFDDI